MKIDSNYYHKDDLVWEWECKNRRVVHYISLLASFIATVFMSRCSIVSSSVVYKVGTEKPIYFYVVLLMLGVVAIGCGTIINSKLEYIQALSINNEDYEKFIKAMKTTYFDKLVIFAVYLAVYSAIGFGLVVIDELIRGAVI